MRCRRIAARWACNQTGSLTCSTFVVRTHWSTDLVWRLDVHKPLDEVRALDLSQRRVEGLFTHAGDDQAHQAGANHNFIHHVP